MSRLTALIAIAVALPLAPAVAAPSTVRVATADLDLATDGGRTALDRRIAAAAGRVCSGLVDNRDLDQMMACRADAVEQARAQTNGGTGPAALR